MATPLKTVTIYDRQYQPKVGSFVIIDGRSIGELLLKGDDFADGGFRGSQFRYPINSGPIKTLACDVEITGRTMQRKNGDYYIRCKIVWVGDCEPDTNTSGWILASSAL